MSSVQSGSRRHSARLQQKENVDHGSNGAIATRKPPGTKKRKGAFEEEDEGFVFTRAKNKKARNSEAVHTESVKTLPTASKTPSRLETADDGRKQEKEAPTALDETDQPPKQRRKRKMSFSTPARKDQQPATRSKRLFTEAEEIVNDLVVEAPPQPQRPITRKEEIQKLKSPAPEQGNLREQPSKSEVHTNQKEPLQQEQPKEDLENPSVDHEESHSSTKINLPFADTPVISRNKAMREGKAGKNERRSSLGLRGRRASSLIDSGSSNGSDLLEPRRMRQLLTWCATRNMHPKPQGTTFEEASARSAARVIEEELLKDLADKSEMSDWFNREDTGASVVPLPERPHPKNLENATKIVEVEEQLRRLRAEKEALEALLRPPSIAKPHIVNREAHSQKDSELLSENDTKALELLNPGSSLSNEISSRVNQVVSALGPAIDTFADGVHKINLYRITADNLASEVLSTCAEKIAQREKVGKMKALGTDEVPSPRRDLSSVLRGLSKAGR
ncbi:hypothetical protein LTS08_006826 [Lithohypha guttulata]|nr:hypothetical protein LTS08_006826 [Lithohypha guttulata]